MPGFPLKPRALVAIFAVLVFVYLRYHVRPPREAAILQASVAYPRLHDLLLERQPIVLTERVQDARDLVKTVFRWQVLRTVLLTVDASSGSFRRNRARYAIVHVMAPPGVDKVELEMVREHRGQRFAVNVAAAPAQVVIVPPFWNYCLLHPEAHAIVHELYDVAYTLLGPWL